MRKNQSFGFIEILASLHICKDFINVNCWQVLLLLDLITSLLSYYAKFVSQVFVFHCDLKVLIQSFLMILLEC